VWKDLDYIACGRKAVYKLHMVYILVGKVFGHDLGGYRLGLQVRIGVFREAS
jgi:hypothetical protein